MYCITKYTLLLHGISYLNECMAVLCNETVHDLVLLCAICSIYSTVGRSIADIYNWGAKCLGKYAH